VNKGDRPGVENTEKALKSMLDLAHPTEKIFRHHGKSMNVTVPGQIKNMKLWIPPIQRTISTEGVGIPELAELISKHAMHLQAGEGWSSRVRIRLQVEMESLLQESLMNRFRQEISKEKYDEVFEKVFQRHISPWE